MKALEQIDQLIEQEVASYDPLEEANRTGGMGKSLPAEWHRKQLANFQNARIEPEQVTLKFDDGSEEICWAVTTASGQDYRVVWMPAKNEFSMAMIVQDGLRDINIRGDAIGCFASM